MKYTLFLSLLFWLSFQSFSQNTILEEDFSSSTFPPNNWTIDNHATQWSLSSTTYSGGSQGEAHLAGGPNDFWGITRFISPSIDLSTSSNVSLEFLHNLFFSTSLQGNGVIGVATRSNGGAWTSIWEVNVVTNLQEQTINLPINNADASSNNFQFCFYFDGTSYIMDWYLDNIHLYSSTDHDISALSISGPSVYNTNASYTPEATIKNAGLNAETFDVICTIYDENNTQLYTNTQTVSNLASSVESTLTFNPYTLSNSNAYYRVVVNSNLSTDVNSNNDSVQKNIYTYTHSRDQVVLEIGTGTWCANCQGAALGADELIENGKDIAVIEYHSDDNYSTATGVNRINYYGIQGFPTSIFDGVTVEVGGNPNSSLYNTYLPLYDQRKVINTGVTIDMLATPISGGYNVNVDLNKVGPIYDTNTVLFLVLTESHIAESWQSLNELNNVERMVLPNSNGQMVDLVNNSNISSSFNVQIDNSWNLNELEVIVFIQNRNTKEILNGSKAMLTDIVGVNDLSNSEIDVNVFPNPSKGDLTIVFDLNLKSNSYSMDFISVDGKVVSERITLNSSNQIKSKKFKNLKSGLYFLSIKDENQNVLKTIKIIKQ